MKFILSFLFTAMILVSTAQRPVASTKLEIFGDHVFIQLSVDGSEPLDFIFDSGDGLSIIDTDVALKLGMPLDNSVKGTSAQGSVAGTLIKHNFIDMNGVRLEKDITLYATSLKHLEINIGRNIDGIIGYDLMNHYTILLDELNKRMNIYDPEQWKYTGIGERFDMEFEKGMPVIEGAVTLNNDEELMAKFFVSTGAATTMDFNSRFAAKNEIISKTGEHYSYLTKGIGNTESLHYEGRVSQFKLGKIRFENMPVGISTAKSGVQAHKKVAGIIGNRILKNYIMVIDKSSEALFLERHIGTKTDDFHVNASGFEIQLDPDSDNLIVHKVYEMGPGFDKGVKLHDVILSVNGVSCSELELPEVVETLNTPGKEVTLEIVDGGAVKTITYTPKELI